MLLIGVVCAAGCAALSPVRPVEPGHRMGGRDFSVLPPQTPGWYVTRRASDGVWFGMPTGKGMQHTIIAFAAPDSRPLTADGLKAIEGRCDAELMQAILHGVTVVSRNTRRADGHGRVCVETVFEVDDPHVPGAAGALFRMKGIDRFCAAREEPGGLVVHAGYSQRFARGEEPVAIDAEGQAFLDSLEFEGGGH